MVYSLIVLLFLFLILNNLSANKPDTREHLTAKKRNAVIISSSVILVIILVIILSVWAYYDFAKRMQNKLYS